jgi:8-oxo-dGTP diphosphatase
LQVYCNSSSVKQWLDDGLRLRHDYKGLNFKAERSKKGNHDMPSVGVFAAIFDDQRRILCVKMNYGPKSWTTPGGQLDENESPIEALKREALEEANCQIKPKRLVGVYCIPSKDDLLLFIEAELVEQCEWQPNDEISEIGFFAWADLPSPMDSLNLTRIQDAFEGKSGIVRVLDPELES